jgi:hypothetical protein
MLAVAATVKGSGGATTLAVGLAARWPQPGAVVVEADPAGGDLAARFGHHPEPGLVGLVTATRRRADPDLLGAYAQRTTLDVDVVFAPPGGNAAGAVQELVARGRDMLAGAAAQRLVVLDVGRLDTRSAALPLLEWADVLLVVTVPHLELLQAVDLRRDELTTQAAGRGGLRLVLRGTGAFDPTTIGRDLRLPVAGRLPEDPTGAAVLAGRARPGRGWTRTMLARAARGLALDLARDTGINAGASDPAPVAAPADAPSTSGQAVERVTG